MQLVRDYKSTKIKTERLPRILREIYKGNMPRIIFEKSCSFRGLPTTYFINDVWMDAKGNVIDKL